MSDRQSNMTQTEMNKYIALIDVASNMKSKCGDIIDVDKVNNKIDELKNERQGRN